MDSIGYPVITFYDPDSLPSLIAHRFGTPNATGQIPQLIGNFGLIDHDTPKVFYTMPSWADNHTEMQLVFSDEFNTDGRSFYPGDDPYWEAVDLHYWVRYVLVVSTRNNHWPSQATNNLEWYDPEAITTQNGSLVITLSEKETHGLDFEGGTYCDNAV